MSGLVTEFERYVSNLIDEEGVYPAPGMSIDMDGKREVAALCEPETAFKWFW